MFSAGTEPPALDCRKSAKYLGVPIGKLKVGDAFSILRNTYYQRIAGIICIGIDLCETAYWQKSN
jgi:hypothetical protein